MKKLHIRLFPILSGLHIATLLGSASAQAQPAAAQAQPAAPQAQPAAPQAQPPAPQAPTAEPAEPRALSASDIPTLETALALARERAPEVVVARAEVQASRSAGVGARVSPLLNPYLEIIAEHGARGVTRDLYITAQLHTPLEVAGQRGRRIAEADAFVDWHSASLERLRARISGAVVRSFGECVTLAARFDTLTEMLTSANTEARVLGARRDAGDATERDAQLAEAERARIAVQLEETRGSLGSALYELGRLTGRRFRAPDSTHLFPKGVMSAPSAQQAPMAPAVLGAQAEARFYGRMDERLDRERFPPVSFILQAGRGDFTETRMGAGLAWSIPAFRYNQGERARARAEAERARVTASAFSQSIAQRLSAIAQEDHHLRSAVQKLDQEAIPAAALATDSAIRMNRAGKTDLLSVVVAKRDLYLLRLRRLDIAQREWQLLSDWVELTGKMPK